MTTRLLLTLPLLAVLLRNLTLPAYDGLAYLAAGQSALDGHALVWPGMADFQAFQEAYRSAAGPVCLGDSDFLPFVSLPPAIGLSALLAWPGAWFGTQALRVAGMLSWLLVTQTALGRWPDQDRRLGVTAATLLLLPLVSFTVQVGQVTPLLAAGAVAGPAWLSGSLLAAATAFKAWPAALVVVLAWQRSWTRLAWATASGLALTGLAATLVPWSAWPEAVAAVQRFGSSQDLPSNLAPWAVLSEASWGSTIAWTGQLSYSTLVGLLVVVRLRGGQPWTVAWAGLSLAVPLVWLHYLLVPAAAWLCLGLPGSSRTLAGRWCSWGLALSTVPLLWLPAELQSPLGLVVGTAMFALAAKPG